MERNTATLNELKHQSNYNQAGIKWYEISLLEETSCDFDENIHHSFMVSYKWYDGKREFTKYGKFFKELKKAEAYYEKKLKDCENKIR